MPPVDHLSAAPTGDQAPPDDVRLEVVGADGQLTLLAARADADAEGEAITITLPPGGTFITTPVEGSACAVAGSGRIALCTVPAGDTVYLTAQDIGAALPELVLEGCATGPDGAEICAETTPEVPDDSAATSVPGLEAIPLGLSLVATTLARRWRGRR